MEMSYLEFLGSLVDQKCEASAYQNGLKDSSIRIKGPAPLVYSAVIEILKTAAIGDKNFNNPIEYVKAVSETVIEELEMEEV